MSDIWIKASTTGTTRWKKATAIHIKRLSATWSAAKNIWIKTGTSAWLRVWPLSGVFSTSDPYITTTASGTTPIYFDGSPIRIGTTYYGRNGTWDANGWTISSYTYAWPYWDTSVVGTADQLGTLATGTFTSPSNALTISSQANASAADGKYISFRITANASNSAYNGTADSENTYGRSKVIRRTPINTTFSISGTPDVGSTLSVSSSWNTTEAYKPDAARTTIYWYRSNSNTSIYNGQGRTQITSANGSYSYIVQPADLGSYIIAEETTFNTGSDYDIGQGLFTNGLNQVTAVTAIVADTTPQAFSTVSFVKNHPTGGSGGVVRTTSLSWNASTNATRYEIEYEGSNDNSTWTTVQSFAASPYTSSTSQSVSWGSPKPAGGFDYYYFMRARVRASNTSSATQVIGDNPLSLVNIYASGSNPGQPSFGSITTGSTTASIPVTQGSDGSNYLYSPPFEYQYRTSGGSYSGTWTSSSSPISLTGLSGGTTYYIKVRTRNYDELVSPENETNFATTSVLTPPTIYNVTAGNSSGQPVTVYFTGGSGPYYQIWWTLGVGGTGYDEYGYSSPITDNTGPTSADTNWYAYVRSVSSLTNVGTGPSTTISEWSTGYRFTVTQAPIIPTITMGSNTNVGTGGATINWSSTNQSYAYVDGTYVGNVNSYTFTGKSSSTTYSGTVTVYSTTGNTASANYSFTTTSASVIPTITMGSNTGVTYNSGTINWTSTNQASFSSNGTFSGSGTTATSISKTGLSASTTYTGTVTVTSSTSNTASASYSLTTSAAPAAATFVIGTVSASRTATRQITGTWTSTRSGGTFQWWNTRIRNTVSGATATHSLFVETPKSDVYTSLTGTSYRFGVQGVSYDSNYSVYVYTVGTSDMGAYTENSSNINPA